LIEGVFKKNRVMERAMGEAFESVVNQNLNVSFIILGKKYT
jgi:hypothetical protein